MSRYQVRERRCSN